MENQFLDSFHKKCELIFEDTNYKLLRRNENMIFAPWIIN